jgi:uncharacterized protein YqeY
VALKDRIGDEMKLAMKSGDKLRLDPLRSIRAALMEKEIAKRGKGEMTEEDEFAVLRTLAKRRRESIEQFEKGRRKDLVDQERKELEIVESFLPKQLDALEVERILREVLREVRVLTMKDMGKAMSASMQALKGKAEGKLVLEVVKKILESS